MNKLLTLIITLMASFSAFSQETIILSANGKTASVTLEQNSATAELLTILHKGPVILSMTENGGFEKIGNLPQSLPTSDVRQTAQPGDIMLYLGNVMCIFYGSNTWAYTKLGTITEMSAGEIKEFLSGNPVSVTVSLGTETGVDRIDADYDRNDTVYDLQGNRVSRESLSRGIYIVNGKKSFIQ